VLLTNAPASAGQAGHDGPFRLRDWAGECWRGERQKFEVFEICQARWTGDREIGVTLNRAPGGVGITVSRIPCGRYYYPRAGGVNVEAADRAESLNLEIRKIIVAAMKAANCSKRLTTTLTAESTEQFLQTSDGLKMLPY
jgi:hypothetical protein